MRELTVILSDVYGLPQLPRQTAPALATIRRYGTRRDLAHGWRSWVAQRFGREDLAKLAPAAVAATALDGPVGGSLYLATPVHLQAALDHVRLGSGGILVLEAGEAAGLAAEFATVFAGSGVTLHPLRRGGWLLAGIAGEPPETCDPARALGGDVAPFLPRGAAARALSALGTELQMWLHGHALNRRRALRGQPTLSGLWLWGGGQGMAASRPQPMPAGCGDDPFLQGLWRANGATLEPAHAAPARFEVEGDVLVEFALFREAAAFGDLADFDRRWLSAALGALRRGQLGGLNLVAGDRLHRLVRSDLWKFWRRPNAPADLGASDRAAIPREPAP